MPLFRRSKKTAPPAATAPPNGPAPDPLMGDQDAHRFQAELAEGRWQEFHEFLEATRDWDDREFYVTKLSVITDRPDWIGEWRSARPGSPLPLLFRGSHGIHWAWQARGAGRAKTVTSDAWPLFFSRLVEADRDLAQAAALDDADPTPHARSIWSAIGLDLDKDEKGRRFGEVARRHRWHSEAHRAMIQALAAKWSGSHKEMFEFARAASAEAPEGHPVRQTIPLAHIERWMHLSQEVADWKERRRLYFLGEPAKEEIRAAADHSIRSPHYVPGKLTPAERNVFAWCFGLMQDYQAQLDQMELIGPLFQKAPWHYQGDPGLVYEQARERAVKAVRSGLSTRR